MRTYSYLVPWLFLYLTTHAAPLDGVLLLERTSSLVKRAPKDAGIGVELEVRSMELKNEHATRVTPEDKASVKGATLISGDGKKKGNTCRKYWDLTAEHTGVEGDNSISELTFEWIINGVTLKMKKSDDPKDDLVLPPIGKEILTATNDLQPKAGDTFFILGIDIHKFGGKGWKLDKPTTYSAAAMFPGIQVTTGLPMEAIQEYISLMTPADPYDPRSLSHNLAGKAENDFVFNPPTQKKGLYVLITKDDLKDIYDAGEITTDLLGFYSLLMSYVNIAAHADDASRAEGPKHRLSIMPRTDFKTLYAMYGRDDTNLKKKNKDCLKRKKKDPKYEDLLEIVKKLAREKNLKDSENIEKATFKWTKPDTVPQKGPSPPPPRGLFNSACRSLQKQAEVVDYKASWATRNDDYLKGELSIKSWLTFAEGKVDPLAVMERLVRNGQVGGLGDTVEKPLYQSDVEDGYGIFEMRDLSLGSMNNIESILSRIEVRVKEWHKTPPSYDQKSKRGLGPSCKKPADDKKCEGNQVEISGKCVECKKGEKPDALHKRCVPDKCSGDTAPNKLKNNSCEKCQKGTKPNVGNTLCVPDGPDKDEKGQCKDEGFILDPREGGQTKATKNPKCVYDDSRNCEKKGQVAVTRSFKNVVSPHDSKSYTPVCGDDKDPNFRCKNSKKTYIHKTRDDFDEKAPIKKSCRSTQARQREMREKYNKTVEKAKEQRKKIVESKQKEKKEGNRRERVGFCTALGLGLNVFQNLQGVVAKRDDVNDFDSLTPDELDGMLEMWPEDDLDPDYIQDHMVTIGLKPTTTTGVSVGPTEGVAAGRPFPIYWLARGIGKLIKIFKKPGRAAPPSKEKNWYSGFKNAGGRGKSTEKAVQAAKSSSKIKEIFKKDMMKQCLKSMRSNKAKRDESSITTIDIDTIRVTIDWKAQGNNYKIPSSDFEDRVISVKLGKDTDNIEGDGGATDWASTYPDRINRPGRLEYEACQTIPDDLKNAVTAVETWGGCCGFYADNDCKESSFMFAMQDREDWQLDGKHNDNMEAVWCTFEANCQGAPGAK